MLLVRLFFWRNSSRNNFTNYLCLFWQAHINAVNPLFTDAFTSMFDSKWSKSNLTTSLCSFLQVNMNEVIPLPIVSFNSIFELFKKIRPFQKSQSWIAVAGSPREHCCCIVLHRVGWCTYTSIPTNPSSFFDSLRVFDRRVSLIFCYAPFSGFAAVLALLALRSTPLSFELQQYRVWLQFTSSSSLSKQNLV